MQERLLTASRKGQMEREQLVNGNWKLPKMPELPKNPN
jgi:hypothetical protein